MFSQNSSTRVLYRHKKRCSGPHLLAWTTYVRPTDDEITTAYSLSFSLDGSYLYAGYNKTIRIFDKDYPVRSCRIVKTYDSQRKDGQTGIISCFAFSPVGSTCMWLGRTVDIDAEILCWDVRNMDKILFPALRDVKTNQRIYFDLSHFNHHHHMMATASGQRHFHNFDYDSSDSAEDEDMQSAEMWDYSLRLWQMPLLGQ